MSSRVRAVSVFQKPERRVRVDSATESTPPAAQPDKTSAVRRTPRPAVAVELSARSDQRLGQQDLRIPERALGKSTFAVAEVELPHAQEGVAVAERTHAV